MVIDPLMARWLRHLVPRSRRRADRANFLHNLPLDHGETLFHHQDGRCAITALPFTLAEFPGVLVKHPFAPSVDRIVSSSGYTVDNVRLVCIAVNFGMGQWGEELYLTFARAAVAHSDGSTARLEADRPQRWTELQHEKIAAAQATMATLSGESLLGQRRRVASLKRALTLGPTGLRFAAERAVAARNSRD